MIIEYIIGESDIVYSYITAFVVYTTGERDTQSDYGAPEETKRRNDLPSTKVHVCVQLASSSEIEYKVIKRRRDN